MPYPSLRDEEPEVSAPAFKFPTFTWSSFETNRAAIYNRRTNEVELNEDFVWFKKLAVTTQARSGATEGVVVGSLREIVETSMVEILRGLQQLEEEFGWGREDVAKALSPEALTAAIAAQLDRLLSALNQSVGTKAGKLKKG